MLTQAKAINIVQHMHQIVNCRQLLKVIICLQPTIIQVALEARDAKPFQADNTNYLQVNCKEIPENLGIK